MNNYDDLQRFKDKTHTQQHDFKDFSSQNLAHDYGNWAIINQLSPTTEASTLAMGGHVSLPVPQSVDADTFALKEQPFAAPAALAPAPLPDATPAIFQSVAAQLATPPAAPAFAPAPAASIPPAEPVPMPAPMPAPAPAAPAVAAPVNFSQLFAPKAAETKPAVEKNQPLKSLLERIASCR
ncbi:cellulose biosynthesis protein BcsO [Pseudescherichia sp.]|uniref:cellulose biosynthesis protein BcsO n=1 Tax=Pseudescherichia sp. TaxID=2055881 RepID=UPI00289E7EC4|nr:cellulose biosynthesis protein BcsO [Pseudescherichia sp.]